MHQNFGQWTVIKNCLHYLCSDVHISDSLSIACIYIIHLPFVSIVRFSNLRTLKMRFILFLFYCVFLITFDFFPSYPPLAGIEIQVNAKINSW